MEYPSFEFRTVVTSVLRKRLFDLVDYLTAFMVGDALKVSVILTIDHALPLDELLAAYGELRNRHVLDKWLPLTIAFCLCSETAAKSYLFFDEYVHFTRLRTAR